MAISGMTRLRRLQAGLKMLPFASTDSAVAAAQVLTEARFELWRQQASK